MSISAPGGAHHLQQQHPQHEHDALLQDCVLEAILAHLTQRERLRDAALVCWRWHAAALAACAEAGVLVSPCSARAEAWLRQHGARLQELHVQRGELGVAEGGPGPLLQGLAALTRLEVFGVRAPASLLGHIGDSLQGLRHLTLADMDWGPIISKESKAGLAASVQRACRQLTRLTHLALERCDLHDECVTQLSSSLPELRVLQLACNQLCEASCLAPLPPKLEVLHLSHNASGFDPSRLFAPSDVALRGVGRGGQQQPHEQHRSAGGVSGHGGGNTTGQGAACGGAQQLLRSLHINGLSLEAPHVLGTLTALTCLDASALRLPAQEEGLQQLCRAVAGLSGLQHLQLHGRPSSSVRARDLRAVLCGASLLTHLDLSEHRVRGESCSASQELLAGVRLPQLVELRVETLQDHGSGAALLGLADLFQALPDACPGLQRLHAYMPLSAGFTSRRLRPALAAMAPSLTQLVLLADGGPPRDEHLVLLGGQLTGLRHLQLEFEHQGDKGLTDRGLQALTALNELTQLSFRGLGRSISDAMQARQGCLRLSVFEKNGRVTKSVQQQLRERCSRSPQLWKDNLADMEAQLRAAKRDAQAAKKEAAQARKKAAAAQRDAKKAQTELAALKKHMEELGVAAGGSGT